MFLIRDIFYNPMFPGMHILRDQPPKVADISMVLPGGISLATTLSYFYVSLVMYSWIR